VSEPRGRNDSWRLVVEAESLAEGRRALEVWRQAHPEVADEDIRIDTIRTTGPDAMRAWIRESPTS